MTRRFDVIIVGGGIAGSAAALRAAQYQHLRVSWLRGDGATRKRSRSQWVANIDNMIAVHDGIVRRKLIRRLRGDAHAAARNLLSEGHDHISTRDIIRNTVERIETSYAQQVRMYEEAATSARAGGDGFVVVTGSGEYAAPWLVLATGVMDRQPRIRRDRGDVVIDDPRWIYPFANRETVLYCIRCEGHLTAATPTAVIGHGETAAQVAMMLHERHASACTVLTNGEEPGWSQSSGRLLGHYGVRVRAQRIADVVGERGDLRGFRLDDGAEVSVRFALVALGLHRVYNDLARDLGADLADPSEPVARRHVLIDSRAETSVSGLFAIGDMAARADETVMKQIYTAQEYAVRAIDTIDRRVRMARREKLGDAGTAGDGA